MPQNQTEVSPIQLIDELAISKLINEEHRDPNIEAHEYYHKNEEQLANQGFDFTLPTASYIGAGTDFNYNVLHHVEPVDNVDAAAFRHDYAYTKDPTNASTADLITIKEMMLVKPTSVTETVHKYAGITGLALKSLIYNNATIPIAKLFASEETKIDPVVDRVYHQSINSIPTYYGVDIGF